ncbi:hypothetical protein [Paenibacillus sp. FSL E2-0178]|uniref:hypothetical protein n=1 Tax=Paenibacillus sp. FSL E2-0178 TaxID=2921361 RepID=UPI00315845F5
MQQFEMRSFLQRFTNDVDDLQIYDVLNALPSIRSGVWLAGGAIRKTLQGIKIDSDFDFFFRSKEQFDTYEKELIALGAKLTRKTEPNHTYCLTFKNEPVMIQLIKINYYKDAEAVIDSFDFTITQFAYDGTNLYCGDYSLWDLPRKKLALNKMPYGVSTMRRLIKYTNQGFTACAGVMQSILQSVVDDPSVINSDVVSID